MNSPFTLSDYQSLALGLSPSAEPPAQEPPLRLIPPPPAATTDDDFDRLQPLRENLTGLHLRLTSQLADAIRQRDFYHQRAERLHHQLRQLQAAAEATDTPLP